MLRAAARPRARTRLARSTVMSVLVSGAAGFVGTHLIAALGREARPLHADVRDAVAVREAVALAPPDAVVHLAASAAVSSSWSAPADTWHVNAIGTVNVLEGVREEAPAARVLVVSSGEVYGAAREVPIDENYPPLPLSPYAASKVAAEVAAGQAARAHGLDVVVARPFPHAGPGQSERFAVGSWALQLARLEAAGGGTLRVGNLSVQRDLLDVRDVCRAYALLLDPAVQAGVYNVASGRAVELGDVVDTLVSMVDAPVEVVTDAARLRRVDIAVLVGDATRLRSATDWEPTIPLETTLADTLAAARKIVQHENDGD